MKQRSGFALFAVIALIVVLFIFDNVFNLSLGNRLSSFFRPVGIVFEGFGSKISGSFSSIGNIGKLQKENNELKDKLDKSLAEIAKLTEAQKENISLKRDLDFKQNNDFDLLSANVIYFDPANIRESITINRGKSDGLKDGNIVLSEGFLVGKIVDAKEHTSKIKLISDPASAVPATVSTSTVTGIVKGRIGNGLNMEQVPQSEKISMDDVIVTSGLGGEFPKGIIIGKVEEVQKISGSIFQQVSIRPIIDLGRLERVMVIRN